MKTDALVPPSDGEIKFQEELKISSVLCWEMVYFVRLYVSIRDL